MTSKKIMPPYMKSSVSPQFLAANPLYKKIFFKCPICNNYSLKPLGLNKINRVTEILDEEKINERKCGICGYTHVKNLSVFTTPSSSLSNATKELGEQITQIGNEFLKIDVKNIDPGQVKNVREMMKKCGIVVNEENRKLIKMWAKIEEEENKK